MNSLQWAVKRASPNVVAYLLTRQSLDLQKFMEQHTTLPPPLCLAAIAGNPYMIVLLLHCGADITATTFQGQSVLHLLAKSGCPPAEIDLAHILIQKGAKVDAKDNGGLTPFDWAVIFQNFVLATTLLKHGAIAISLDSQVCFYTFLT